MGNPNLKNLILFLGLFGFMALPTLWVQRPEPKTVSLQFPPEKGRKLASLPRVSPKKKCQPVKKWRYRCDDDKKNCVKDGQFVHLECQ